MILILETVAAVVCFLHKDESRFLSLIYLKLVLGSNQKFVAGCLGLKDVQITMPEAVIKGREATLQCNFALEGEKLYSLKW